MTPTEISEAGLEALICCVLTGSDCWPWPVGTPELVTEATASLGAVGWLPGDTLHPSCRGALVLENPFFRIRLRAPLGDSGSWP